jgi:hypothetical protein
MSQTVYAVFYVEEGVCSLEGIAKTKQIADRIDTKDASEFIFIGTRQAISDTNRLPTRWIIERMEVEE